MALLYRDIVNNFHPNSHMLFRTPLQAARLNYYSLATGFLSFEKSSRQFSFSMIRFFGIFELTSTEQHNSCLGCRLDFFLSNYTKFNYLWTNQFFLSIGIYVHLWSSTIEVHCRQQSLCCYCCSYAFALHWYIPLLLLTMALIPLLDLSICISLLQYIDNNTCDLVTRLTMSLSGDARALSDCRSQRNQQQDLEHSGSLGLYIQGVVGATEKQLRFIRLKPVSVNAPILYFGLKRAFEVSVYIQRIFLNTY